MGRAAVGLRPLHRREPRVTRPDQRERALRYLGSAPRVPRSARRVADGSAPTRRGCGLERQRDRDVCGHGARGMARTRQVRGRPHRRVELDGPRRLYVVRRRLARAGVAAAPHRSDGRLPTASGFDRRYPSVFFLGFAGVGGQKVFAEEARLAERLISERYGAGRSLLLINDQRDLESRPLATVHGLRRALRRIGERMDRSKDVLFLLLTSHGSERQLSVSNRTWPLEQLDAVTLRNALDDSGIQWRVIVISACHSGAFISPLADESTAIFTSAAADSASFGCSDDRDITEFGAAFVRDALLHATSLEAAFVQAKAALPARELSAHLQPSAPQARVGTAPSQATGSASRPRGPCHRPLSGSPHDRVLSTFLRSAHRCDQSGCVCCGAARSRASATVAEMSPSETGPRGPKANAANSR